MIYIPETAIIKYISIILYSQNIESFSLSITVEPNIIINDIMRNLLL